MGVWDRYNSRSNVHGKTRREAALRQGRRWLNSYLPASPSSHRVIVNDEETEAIILDSDNLNIKTICMYPGEPLSNGSMVLWNDQSWLVTALDANNELYFRGTMQQCNYLLRWISTEGKIVERWSIVEDGTKYLTGDYSDRDFVVTRGDSRISLTLPKDSETIRLERENRFIIDDYDAQSPLAYKLTKPFKLGGTFNGEGVLRFVLTECNTEDTDNLQLHIPNYYKYFPRKEIVEGDISEVVPVVPEPPHGKESWL